MQQLRNRRGLLIAAVVAIVLVAGFGFYRLTHRTSATPQDLVKFFPQRDATLLYIDVAGVRASGLLDKLVGSTVGEEAEYKGFVQGTGFDYKRDLDEVMLNSEGGVHYFVLRGRFDWNKLKNYAAKQGGTCQADYCFMKGSTPDRIISWRPLTRDVMALASTKDESGARAVEFRSDAELPWKVPQTPLWLHLPASAVRSAAAMPAGTRMFAKALEAAERTMLTLGPSRDQFQLGMDVVCRNPEDAAVLKAQLDGLTKLLSSLIAREKKTPNAGDLSGVLTSGTFNRTDNHVYGSWAIRRSFLDSLGGG